MHRRMIDIRRTHVFPAVITVSFRGVLHLDEAQQALGAFQAAIAALEGAPFRILCDMRDAAVMPGEVADLFLRAQDFAVQIGLVRDAFVTKSATFRLQLTRLAREGVRSDKLGPLPFFDAMEDAERWITAPL